jgi:hypothetical protein
VPVLDDERIVQAELVAGNLELVLGRILVRDDEAGRIGRDLEEDHVRHEAHDDDEQDRPQTRRKRYASTAAG